MGITICFVSNYLNHHQIPFCDEMYRLLNGSFRFIQTQTMEQERINMGWNTQVDEPYLVYYDNDPQISSQMIMEAKIVIFGGSDEESYIAGRLESGKPVLRYCERMYKTGQWRFISPRGLKKKYHDHTRHSKKPVYLLCAGAYVASDYHLIRAYSEKMYRWGYFTSTKEYDITELMNEKGWITEEGEKVPYLLWTARMIGWKHPELALETARYLKEKGEKFHMDLIGEGPVRKLAEELCRKYQLEKQVSFLGAKKPEEVRAYMEKANIFLFTSDRNEGWGAVVNEAMNSGCAVIANHMIGSVPFLISDGENGYVYRDKRENELFSLTQKLIKDPFRTKQMGINAYRTITLQWNEKNASKSLLSLCIKLGMLETGDVNASCVNDLPVNITGGPCSVAPVVSERKMYRAIKNHLL